MGGDMCKLSKHNFALVFCLTLWAANPIEVAAEEKPVGKIVILSGTVDFRSSGSIPLAGKSPGDIKPVAFTPWKKAKRLQEVFATDEFRTSRRSRVKILFSDNSLMALGPNSQLKILSYLYQPEEKLRKGKINVKQGLYMYVINKSQNHKDSEIRIVTPTANIAARGTQGYLSVSDTNTIVANESGTVEVSNIDPTVSGTVIVGESQLTQVEEGKPPTEPETIGADQFADVGTLVNGLPPEESNPLDDEGLGEGVMGEGSTDEGVDDPCIAPQN